MSLQAGMGRLMIRPVIGRNSRRLSVWCQVLAILGGRLCLLQPDKTVRVVAAFSFSTTRRTLSTTTGRRPSVLRVAEESSVSATAESTDLAVQVARERLQPYFSYPLDDWQLQAGGEILNGKNVIVCAPTGSGKTVVGEMALHIAVENGANAIYTTPLKALSNQKFADLRPIFGRQNVGLSTGDMSINHGARLTVMTTEVYRNMAWRSSGGGGEGEHSQGGKFLNTDELASNGVVVLDEFHYMGQPGRGGVWEESVITSPSHTQIVALSATLPNAAQLASWMESVTGRETVLVQAPGKRPVPLRYLFASKDGLYPMFRDPDAGPGAPKGLLGWRGDGISETLHNKDKNKTQYKKGFRARSEEDRKTGNKRYPKGLQVNPTLQTAAKRRIQKVNRSIERLKLEAAEGGDQWDERRFRRRGSQTMSPREERRMRESMLKKEMRRAVPSLSIVVKRLERRGLLPAIFFIFSRAGCDDAAETLCDFMRNANQSKNQGPALDVERSDGKRKRNTRQRGKRHGEGNIIEDPSGRTFRSNSNHVSDDVLASVLDWSTPSGEILPNEKQEGSPLSSKYWEAYANLGLLSLNEVKDVASRVAAFNNENQEIAFGDATIRCFMFGVGSHHAGMLPAHKAFTEAVYRAQLMKVVFATETLAAGINVPARTTVIRSLAKRDGGSTINLLETSNLLQMAGRAGRRGMDTDGTCVIAATPFEGAEEAVSILTSEIKPIVSQFSPSYSLAVNLIARGEGQLDVARQLVQKSFAMWEKRQAEDSLESVVETNGDGANAVLQRASHERFLEVLVEALETQVDAKRAQTFLNILKDHKVLKKTIKSYVGAVRLLDLERSTLECLQRELETMETLATDEEKQLLGDLLDGDQTEIVSQIEAQRKRVLKTVKQISKHPFTEMALMANELMAGSKPAGRTLLAALQSARTNDGSSETGPLSAEELTVMAKSAVVMKRRTRKLESANPNLDAASLLFNTNSVESFRDDTWQDMLAITKVLVAYGCLSMDTPYLDNEDVTDAFYELRTYQITPAGVNIGRLGFENSLWCLVAIGGAFDVVGASSELDEFQAALEAFDDDSDGHAEDRKEKQTAIPIPQREAEKHISLLRTLTPSELAGYVACLVSEGSRGGSVSIVDAFQSLSPGQQRAIQSLLLCMERFAEVQKKMSVDESTRRCDLELSTCEVVTAWAAGCTWDEAVKMSGTAPGDLARTLSRALDALRQFGSLPFTPVRAIDGDGATVKAVADGVHPGIRRLCREAARAMDRYPVKDPLPFDMDEDDIADDLLDATEDIVDDLEQSEDSDDDLNGAEEVASAN